MKATLKTDFNGRVTRPGGLVTRIVSTPWSTLETRFEGASATASWTSVVRLQDLRAGIISQIGFSGIAATDPFEVRVISLKVWFEERLAQTDSLLHVNRTFTLTPRQLINITVNHPFQTIAASQTPVRAASLGFVWPRAHQININGATATSTAAVAELSGDVAADFVVIVRILWRRLVTTVARTQVELAPTGPFHNKGSDLQQLESNADLSVAAVSQDVALHNANPKLVVCSDQEDDEYLLC